MSVTVIPLAPTREQFVEVLAALQAAADVLHELHEADSPAGEYFGNLRFRLQCEAHGGEREWSSRDPLEVEVKARASELEAAALEEVERSESLDVRIRTLRVMASRYRQLGTIDVMFDVFLKCDSCGRSIGERTLAHGWTALYNEKRDWHDVLCPACTERRHDAS